MKKITMKALIFVFTVLGLWSVPERTGAMQIPRKMETCEDADEWISIFLGEDPDALSGEWEMTPQMDAAVSSLGGMKGMAASLAMLREILNECGPDSRAGLVASVMMGSSETVFYTCGVYLAAAHVKKTRHIIPCALMAWLAGSIMAGALV